MTWVDDTNQKFNDAMEQLKGQSFPCAMCCKQGTYDEDLVPFLTNIGEWGILKGSIYTASVETSFMCKDEKACEQRRKRKSIQ